MISISIADSSGVAEARRKVATAARAVNFDEADAGRAAIIATELGSNILKHAQRGAVLVGAFDDPTGAGIEVIALDQGPGIADLAESRRDGHSTAGTPGNGLGAVLRQSQGCWIHSQPGQGTVVIARLRPGQPSTEPAPSVPAWGGVCLPKPGEEAVGDCWGAVGLPNVGHAVMVADGLGHGPAAALASAQAARIFAQNAAERPSVIMQAIHNGLRSTRGAAVAVARVDTGRNLVSFAGIGNISGTLLTGSTARRMVSHNGTAGHFSPRIREFEYPLPAEERSLLILHSDGIGSGWDLRKYPGLAGGHPTMTAAILYRDFFRGRDDATVLVAEGGSLG